MEEIFLNLIPTGNHPTCHASQYDVGRQIKVNLFDGAIAYALQEGDSLVLDVKKPNAEIVSAELAVTIGEVYAYIVTVEQMCDIVGRNECELRLKNGTKNIGTLNFYIEVEEAIGEVEPLPPPTPARTYKICVVAGQADVRFRPYIIDNIFTHFLTSIGIIPLTEDENFPVYDKTKSFRIHIRAKMAQGWSKSQVLIGDENAFFNMPSIEFSNTNGTTLIWAGFSTNRSSWTSGLTIETSEIPRVYNQWYEIDYEYSATDNIFSLTVSDGENTVTKTANTGGNFNMVDTPYINLGGVAKSSNHNAQYVSIDYANTYWEEDGVILWGNKEAS